MKCTRHSQLNWYRQLESWHEDETGWTTRTWDQISQPFKSGAKHDIERRKRSLAPNKKRMSGWIGRRTRGNVCWANKWEKRTPSLVLFRFVLPNISLEIPSEDNELWEVNKVLSNDSFTRQLNNASLYSKHALSSFPSMLLYVPQCMSINDRERVCCVYGS